VSEFQGRAGSVRSVNAGFAAVTAATGPADGKVLASTIPENAPMMAALLGVKEQRFKVRPPLPLTHSLTHLRTHPHQMTHWRCSHGAPFPPPLQPSIPNLVYQYSMYANYESPRLTQPNPEIPED
jgi:hypothetical protein